MDKRWTRPGGLYIVATPIGNREDMSPRARDVLREADLIAMEDTRVSLPWLRRIGVEAPFVSYHAHSPAAVRDAIVSRALAGETVALISDAGLPAVSDPGQELVEHAWAKGVPVSVIPGPSAGISAFAGSGFPLPVTLWGFLPARGRARADAVARVLAQSGSQVLYEAPTRLVGLLDDLASQEPERLLTVVRELSKLHEEWWRGTLALAGQQFRRGPVRGEITLVLGPKASQSTSVDWDAVLKHVDVEVAHGRSPREAIEKAAREAGIRRRALYRRWHLRQTT